MPDHIRLRVLVVEDEYMLALNITGAVSELGCDVVGPTGQMKQAMALAEREPFDAAILDLNLRGDMTFPVARRLRDRGLPFLFLTGYDPGSIPDEFAETPLLEKPFTDEELISQLRRLLDGKRTNEASVSGLATGT